MLAKERLTICLLYAANGEKFQPLVIGKAARPRAFNNKMPNDIIWKSNTKAWMAANIFKEYIQIWNKEMIQENIKILHLHGLVFFNVTQNQQDKIY